MYGLNSQEIWQNMNQIVKLRYSYFNLNNQKNTFLKKGFFAERPLPSAGLIPFFRTFICELNYSCYPAPLNHNYDKLELTNLINISSNFTLALAPFANISNQLINLNLTNINITNLVDSQRDISTNITSKIASSIVICIY